MTMMDELISIIERGASKKATIEQIIKIEIDLWSRSINRYWMLTGDRYYRGEHDILSKKRTIIGDNGKLVEVTTVANNRIAHPFMRKVVDQKIGYLLGKPMGIETDEGRYQNLLDGIFDKNFMRLLVALGKEAIIKGIAWLHVYYDETGGFKFKRIPSEEIIPLWRDTDHTELDAVIRIYEVEVYDGLDKRVEIKVEYWDTTGVHRYVYSGGGLVPDVEAGEYSSHFALVQNGVEKGFNWELVPFIAFKYNPEEIPLIKIIKPLIDEYDARVSDTADTLEDLPNSIYVVRNYDGADLGEFRHNLATYRAVKVTDDGGVETLALPVDTDAVDAHLKRLRKDLYELGRGVDTQTERIGSSPSGIALKFLYADLDMNANIMESEFQHSLERLMFFVDAHLINAGFGDFTGVPVHFIFNRDIAINEADTIRMIKDSVGILSMQSLIDQHPWTINTQTELERLKEEREGDMAMYPDLNAFTQGGA